MLGFIFIASAIISSRALDILGVVVFVAVDVVVVISLCLLNNNNNTNIAFAVSNEHRKLANYRITIITITPIQTIANQCIHLQSLIKWCIHAHASIS